MGLIKKLLIIYNIIVAIATLGVYINYYIPPYKIFIFPVLGLIFPVLFFLHCFFVVLWLFQDVKWMILSTLCILLGWNHAAGFIGLAGNKTSNLKTNMGILTLNTHFFKDIEYKYGPNAGNVFMNFLNTIPSLDVIALQEFPFKYENFVLERLKGFDIVRYEHKRAVLFTKYPVIAKGEIDFGTSTNSCIWADCKIGDQIVRIYSVHLQSNSITDRADHVLDNLQFRNKKTWSESIDILRRYRRRAITRYHQMDKILQHIESTQTPVILAGDLNEPPNSNLIREVSKRLNDSFKSRGRGVGSTYGGRLPFLRIDYIFVSDHFIVNDLQTHQIDISDHFPVTAMLHLRKEKT